MEYSDVVGFAADAVGEPGARTFLLQFTGPWGRHTYLLEKGQVAALAVGVNQLMEQADYQPDTTVAAPDLVDEPPRLRIGQLTLGYDSESGLVVLTVTPTDEDSEEASYQLTRDQLAAAAAQGEAAVAAGRPRCPRCGLAMDPDGHTCPTSNGDLRHHQP